MDAKIQVMTANRKTLGTAKYSPAAGGKGKGKADKAAPVPARNFGKKGGKKMKDPGKNKGNAPPFGKGKQKK